MVGDERDAGSAPHLLEAEPEEGAGEVQAGVGEIRVDPERGAELRLGRWTATLRGTNLLDARHETSGSFAPDGRAPGQLIVRFLTPGQPLRLVAGLGWEL